MVSQVESWLAGLRGGKCTLYTILLYIVQGLYRRILYIVQYKYSLVQWEGRSKNRTPMQLSQLYLRCFIS